MDSTLLIPLTLILAWVGLLLAWRVLQNLARIFAILVLIALTGGYLYLEVGLPAIWQTCLNLFQWIMEVWRG